MKGDQQRCEDPISLVVEGSCGVHGRDGATESDEHGEKALALKSNAAHEAIHHECSACHVPGVLEKCEGQVEGHQNGHEHEDRSNACNHTVDEQALHPCASESDSADKPGCEVTERHRYGAVNPIEERPSHICGDLEHDPHCYEKDRDTEVPVRNDGVDAI